VNQRRGLVFAAAPACSRDLYARRRDFANHFTTDNFAAE
jgi:hypothetical protein